MIIISQLPNAISARLNALDDEQVISAASGYRQVMKANASIDVDTLEDALKYTNDARPLPAQILMRGVLARPVAVGDVLIKDGKNYVVLAFGFHFLSHF